MARDFEFKLRADALHEVEADVAPVLMHAAELVAERARQSASSISRPLSEAIVADGPHTDEEGPYADIGYDKRKPGFVLWWHEVGTSRFPASPHLRPAASRRVI